MNSPDSASILKLAASRETTRRRRRTKIVCTLGPASTSYEMIWRLARAGMNCARLNFSHGTPEDHLKSIRLVRDISKKMGTHIAVMQDLPGPKIRIGRIAGGSMNLKRGQIVSLFCEEGGDVDNRIEKNEEKTEGEQKEKDGSASPSPSVALANSIPVHKLNLAKYVSVGATIFLADGSIRLEVLSKTRTRLKCRCLNGGTLISGKGVNVPEIQRTFRGFTDLDKEYLEFGLKHDIDLVAVSFIRTASELEAVRAFIAKRSSNNPPWIISKIELKQAVENATSLIRASDAVMVARGDLGVENPIEQVPVIQKMIIDESNAQAIPVITATQMLESMVNNPRPTRAEATDVANAVFDGTDALMLSEETAMGVFPIECVKVLDRVARVAEHWIDMHPVLQRDRTPATNIGNSLFFDVKRMGSNKEKKGENFTRSSFNGGGSREKRGLSHAAGRLASETRSKLIVCSTHNGLLAEQIAGERPRAQILALTRNEATANKLAMVRDVFPVFLNSEVVNLSANVNDVQSSISKMLVENREARAGDRIVFAFDNSEGNPRGTAGGLLFAFEVKK